MVFAHKHRDTGGHISTEPRINERIRVPEVRLVGPAGEQVGIVAIQDALRLAQEADLDLVEVAPMARPPVCKLMDYGKFKYESALKARESRKNQAQTVIKEIKLRPKIDPHDYGTKKGHVERFLKQGDKVKVTIMFRGREQSRPELGFKLLQRLAADVDELGFVESTPKQDGRNMIMVIGPHKRKTDAMAAAKADRGTRTSSRSSASQDERAEAAQAAAAAAAAREPSEPTASQARTSPTAARPAQARATATEAQPEASQAEARQTAATAARPAAERAKPATESARPAAESAKPAKPAAESAKPAAEPAKAAPATATPRPAAPRPQPRPGPAASGTSAPRPTAPRTAASPAPRPGAGSATPRPTAPRGTTAAGRTTASGTPATAAAAARPGPARRSADGPVPSPRAVGADKTANQSAPTENDSES